MLSTLICNAAPGTVAPCVVFGLLCVMFGLISGLALGKWR